MRPDVAKLSFGPVVTAPRAPVWPIPNALPAGLVALFARPHPSVITRCPSTFTSMSDTSAAAAHYSEVSLSIFTDVKYVLTTASTSRASPGGCPACPTLSNYYASSPRPQILSRLVDSPWHRHLSFHPRQSQDQLSLAVVSITLDTSRPQYSYFKLVGSPSLSPPSEFQYFKS